MSKTINNGGPAFPCENIRTPNGGVIVSDGMTMRDYFAAKAMQAIITKYGNRPPHQGVYESADDESARWSYEIADAMLRARGEA